MPGVYAEDACIVTALLNDKRRFLEGSYHSAHFLEVSGLKRPAAGGVLAGRVQSEGNDQITGAVTDNTDKGFLQGFTVSSPVNILRKRDIYIQPPPLTTAFFTFEAAKIGIGIPRMAVDRDSEYVVALIEYLLLAIAVVIIDIQHSDLTILAEKMGGHG